MHGAMTLASKRRKTKPRAMMEARQGIHDRLAQDAADGAHLGTVIVDDPYGINPGDKVAVFRNLRDDPLAALHSAGQIADDQYYAGRQWQKSYGKAVMGLVQAIDPTKEAVDGGRFADPLSDERCRALEDLARTGKLLGQEGEAIVTAILGRGLTLAAAGLERGYTSETERKYLGKRFRECLDTLAIEFGFAMRRR